MIKKECLKKEIYFIFIFIFVASSNILANDLYGVKVEKDIVYVKRGRASLKADIYRPTDKDGNIIEEKMPAFILVHGGAFVLGSKDYQFKEIAKWLAQRGYVAFNITYRLKEDGRFPNNILDVKCAIKYLRGNAKKFNIDKNRIGIMGGSAGGYLAAFVAATGDDFYFESSCGEYDSESAKVQVAIPSYGIYDWESMIDNDYAGAARKLISDYSGVSSDDNDFLQKIKKVSVVSYLTEKTDVKWLIIHGTNDVLVPVQQAYILNDKLKKINADVEIAIIEKGKHGFVDLSTIDIIAYRKATEIMERYLSKKFPSKYFK